MKTEFFCCIRLITILGIATRVILVGRLAEKVFHYIYKCAVTYLGIYIKRPESNRFSKAFNSKLNTHNLLKDNFENIIGFK